jgi:ASC-1-like (ASCH) protein
MPFFLAKKEVYLWLRDGKKTIDVRKGKPWVGDLAIFQSGPYQLRRSIVKTETGKLTEVITENNYRQVIPPAPTLQAALNYLHEIYGPCEGPFTAYYLKEANP